MSEVENMEIIKKETSVVMIDGKATEITISDKRAEELVNSICENNAKGIDLYFNNCELITELRNSNGFYALGYNSFKELAEVLFDSGETQAKNMCLIAQSFGKRNDDMSYTIMDKEILKQYSATQLLLIRGLYDFANCDRNIVKVTEKYGITPKTTCAQLRDLTKFEKNHKRALTFDEVEKLKTEVAKVTSDNKTEATKLEDNKSEATKPEDNKTEATKSEEQKQIKTLTDLAAKESQKVISLKQVLAAIEAILDNKKSDKDKVKDIRELIEKSVK